MNKSSSVSSNEDNISHLYNQVIDKICNNQSPLAEMRALFSYREIKENVRRLSDDRTIDIIEILLSEGKPVLKLIAIKQFHDIMEDKQGVVTLYQVAEELNRVIQGDMSMENLSFLPSITISSDDLQLYYTGWGNYLENTSGIKSIIDNYNLDPILVKVILTFVIWIFVWGGLALAHPVFFRVSVITSTAALLGFVSSLSVGTFFSLDCDNWPFLCGIADKIMQLVGLFYPLTTEQVSAVGGAVACLLFLGIYLVPALDIFNTSTLNFIVEFLSGGSFFFWPPALASLVILLFSTQNT